MGVNYVTMHKRLRVQRGRAEDKDCIDCGGFAKDWSHRHDTDPDDIDNYDPRCRRHHLMYDGGRENYGVNNGNSKLTEEKINEARALYATGEYTISRLAMHFNVGDTTMNSTLRGLTWV